MNITQFNRRHLLRGLATAPVALAVPGAALAVMDEDKPLHDDLVMREIDLLPFADGIVCREDDLELALPLLRMPPAESAPLEQALMDLEATPGPNGDMSTYTVPMPPLVAPHSDAAMAFNLYLPEDGDDQLFEPSLIPGDLGLAVKPSPSYAAESQAASEYDKTVAKIYSDGKVRKKFDAQIARFEVHGIVRQNLPSCGGGNVIGLWMKVDLLGWILGSVNRWKTHSEGSLGYLESQPTSYQFTWTKPSMCGSGASNYEALYNGLKSLFERLFTEIAGLIGKALDRLLRLSASIASFIAKSLLRWVALPNPNPNPGTGGQKNQPPATGSFALSATSTSARVQRGRSVSYTLRVTPANGFNSDVRLTVAGSTGSTASISPPTVRRGNGNARLTLRTASTSPRGTHELTVTGTGGGLTQTLKLTLVID